MKLTLREAEKFVENNEWAEWAGWNIECYAVAHNGRTKVNGAWYNNQWCIKTIINPNDEGEYDVPHRYFRSPGR